MDWADLRIFRIAAEEPTLTAAARRLRLSVATVSRRIDALEAALGLTLFDRSQEGAALTAHGRALLTRARVAASAIDDVGRLAASLRSGGWVDPIRISATEPIIVEILAPALPRLIDRKLDLQVDLVSENDVVSLASRQAELAIRFAQPAGASLIARRLPSIATGLYASSAYLAGRPADAIDLRQERLLGYDDRYGTIPERVWVDRMGLGPCVVARSSSTLALAAATAAGAGISLLPRLIAGRMPGLVALPMTVPLPDRPVWLVIHRDLARAKPLRPVRDWIVDAFRARTG